MKIFFPYLFVCFFFALSLESCRPENEILTEYPDAPLYFSQDTVLFDTLFSSVGSVTKRLKIYNPNEKAVKLEEIALGRGKVSPYRLWVQGIRGDNFSEEIIYGGDSLLLLVEVTVDPEDKNLPFLVKDSLVLRTHLTEQHVKLVAWGQDAHFYKSKGRFSELDCQTTWTADRPYVIYDSLFVAENCELTIQKGSRIYFNQGAGIYIKGSLRVEGTADEPVLFRNDRLDYENVKGQWQGLVFLEGSKDNQIRYAEIRNADVGLWLNTFDEDSQADLLLENTKLENMSSAGILAVNSDLLARNVLANHCKMYTAVHLGGGNYTYEHCTLVGGVESREDEAVAFTDFLENPGDGSLFINPLNVRLVNNIIWGSRDEELLINTQSVESGTIDIQYNLIRSAQEAWNINENILNSENGGFPQFVNPSEYDYRLDSLSPVIDTGKDLMIPEDIEGNIRDDKPDRGAYEWIENQE